MTPLLLPTSTIFAAEPVIKSGDKVAFLGDSITQGGAGHPAGYVRRVESGLLANDIKITVIPAGISGNKSNDMLQRLERDVLSKKPDWMTLSCGVNDVWHGKNGVPLEAYKKNITEIVDKAQAAGIKVMILTATVISEDLNNDNNKKLSEYNAFLKSLATEKKCLFVDLYADMESVIKTKKSKENLLTSDGVHMNPLGDRLMATGILKGFGLNEDQLKKARDKWYDSGNNCRVDVSLSLTLRQYEKLQELADQKGVSVQQIVHEELGKSVDRLLKSEK
jgi:lysophospholipase L1-like esterase